MFDQHYVDLELSFIICFNLLSIRLFQSHDPGREFDRLTLVIFLCLFFVINCFQFHYSTLSLLEIELHNLFWFTFYGVITVSCLDIQIERPTRISPICCCLNIYIKKFILNIFSESNYIFTSHLSYLWTRQGDWITPGRSPHGLNLFSTRKSNNNI
jgi:hypothetical protein